MSANDPNGSALERALLPVLRVLARLVLRAGMSWQEFAELAKHAFVQVADQEFPLADSLQTNLRIATLTGLNRKEVARLRQLVREQGGQAPVKRNRAARVITGWLSDPEFLDAAGRPLALLPDDPQGFAGLVRKHSGDMRPPAIAAELLRVGAIETLANGRLQPTARGYVPAAGTPEVLEILGTDTAELMDTIDYNLMRDADQPERVQLKVVYDNLGQEHVAAFNRLSNRLSWNLLETLNEWLAERDRDTNPDAAGSGRVKLGLGVYQIGSGPTELDQPSDTPTAGETS